MTNEDKKSLKEANLADRMKQYELETKLVPRTPIIARLDGNSFHRVCRNLTKPFDHEFMEMMSHIAAGLGSSIDGCVIVYTQSDEITLVIMPYRKHNSTPLYSLRIQKITSLLASRATALAYEYIVKNSYLNKTLIKPVMFDCRVFNVPNNIEIVKNLLWRIQDSEKNSTNLYGQAYFSHSKLHGKKLKEVRQMLLDKENIYWEGLPDREKKGYLWTYDYKVMNECTNDWKVIVQTALDSYVIEK